MIAKPCATVCLACCWRPASAGGLRRRLHRPAAPRRTSETGRGPRGRPARHSERSGHGNGETRLESLSELSDQPLARRKLDIQSWQTAEGAKVLFVEARELPMFDLRLTFSAGSSQDGDVPGLALLTNVMLNEGVEGKDVSAIARGFEGLGADFGNGSYRDMAVVSLRSLSAPDKREPALALFNRSSASRPSPRTRCSGSRTSCWPASNSRSRTPASWPAWSCSPSYMAITLRPPQRRHARVDSGDRRRAAARLPCPCLRGWKCGDRAGRRPFP